MARDPSKSTPRTVGLLQGPSSWFFDRVGDALIAEGATALRVCFCLGDRLFWRGKPVVWHRGRLDAWPGALARLIQARGLTDLVMLGDSRPRHRAAIRVARDLGVTAHVVEHGYVRPDWLTHEIGGMAARSPVRARFAAGDRAAEGSEAELSETRLFRSSFAAYAAMDLTFNLSNLLSRPVVAPFYGGHSSVWPLVEYAGWLRKLAVSGARGRRSATEAAALTARPGALFLWALQLEADYQIRRDGPPGGQIALIPPVIASFARAAPADAALAVKLHPLDNLWTDWAGRIGRAADAAGIADRVRVLDGGDLDALLARAAGALSVNSTVGLAALRRGVKVSALGQALYDAPGLTAPGGLAALDAFWSAPERPDPAEVSRLMGLLAETQFRGAFDGSGVALGAKTLARRILAAEPAAISTVG